MTVDKFNSSEFQKMQEIIVDKFDFSEFQKMPPAVIGPFLFYLIFGAQSKGFIIVTQEPAMPANTGKRFAKGTAWKLESIRQGHKNEYDVAVV